MEVKLYSKEELVKRSKVLLNAKDSLGNLRASARTELKDIWLEYYLNQVNHKEVKSFLYSSLYSLNAKQTTIDSMQTTIDSIWEYCTGDDIRDFSDIDDSYEED